jgi:hypothetical protein
LIVRKRNEKKEKEKKRKTIIAQIQKTTYKKKILINVKQKDK